MAQPKAYKFYLRGFFDPSWRYYYIDGSDAFADTTTQTELERAPDGWQEMELEWERGFTYYGMFTAFTAPLKFVKDGAQILRHLHYTSGIEAICEIWVEKFNPSTYAYETFFKADLDFSTMVDEYDFVSVAIMENGFPAKLKAREDIEYEIDIAENAAVQYIKHDGIDLQAKMGWGGIIGDTPEIYPTLYYVDTEGTNFSIIPYDPQEGVSPNGYLFKNNTTSAIDVRIQSNFSIYIHRDNVGGGPSYYFNIMALTHEYGTGPITETSLYEAASPQADNSSQTYTDFLDYTITIQPEHVLQFIIQMRKYSPDDYLDYIYYDSEIFGLDVTIYFDNRYETTYVPCLKAMDVYATLIDRISDSKIDPSDIHSTLLETTYLDMFYLLSGDALANFPKSVLKISFADFFKWINVHFGAAFYYTKSDNSVHLEHKESVYSYGGGMGFVVSSVNNAKITPFTSEIFNTLKIGCGEYSYDSKGLDNEVSNGKDECNTNTNWETPIVRVKKNADYVCNIRSDRYGIELVRITLDGKTITDSSTNNELFVIHAEEDDSNTYTIPSTGVTINYHNIYRDAISVGVYELENIYSPETAYNIIFSTKRNIFRNGKWFRSLLKMNDTGELDYTSSSKTNADNSKMQTLVSSVIVFDEGGDELISGLCDDGDELFLPFVIEFETREEINIYNLIESTPYDYIEFVLNGENQLGFIISVASKPALRGTTRFKLLLGRDTDLTTLIR